MNYYSWHDAEELTFEVTVRIGTHQIKREIVTTALDPMAVVRRLIAEERNVDVVDVMPCGMRVVR